ncbi:hypothetical protein [Deinococcus sp.]|uniref:hypothetical protein n=1 Tax=Deinococcus sp. TaxID=47478 RepID=UPI003C7D0749
MTAAFSEVFPLVLTPRHPQRAALQEALELAEGFCGAFPIPPLGLRTEPLRDRDGFFDPLRPELGVRIDDDAEQPALTFIHELAHVLDLQVLGVPGIWESQAPGTPAARTAWQRFFGSVEDTAAYTTLKRYRDGDEEAFRGVRGFASYLLTPHELFARVYAQYVAIQTARPRLLDELRQLQLRAVSPQWSDDEFVTLTAPTAALLKVYGR